MGFAMRRGYDAAAIAALEASALVRWAGWGGSIAGASGALAAETATQSELGGPGTGTNPEELLAAAHANCFTSTLTALARARGVTLDEVQTHATTRLEWDDDGGHRLAASNLELHIRSSSDASEVRELVRQTEEHCPVCRAIRGNVPMTVTVALDTHSGAGA
jgi:Ohr subfamily peroxiredoxin